MVVCKSLRMCSISAWSLSQTATYQCHFQWSTLKDDESNLEQSQFCVMNKTRISILTMDRYFVFNEDPSPLRGRMLDLQNLRMACRCYLFTILTSSSHGRPLQQFLSCCLYCLWALWSRCIVVWLKTSLSFGLIWWVKEQYTSILTTTIKTVF